MMSIFSEAVELPPDERSAFVARACGSDAELLREVVLLLMAHDGDTNSLEAPTVKAASDAPDIGARLQAALGDEFRVERELAGGGMSRVFVAVETKLGRRVVVKVLPPELRAVMSPERFQRETRLAAALRHPHIVPLLAAGESADGLVYFTMPFIEGESLEQRLAREGRLPLADVVAIVHEIADALAHAHANGVVHRDIKPANVLIDGRHAVVADFGLAKAIEMAHGEWDRIKHGQSASDPSAALTDAGFVLGTPAYMSPEQARSGTAARGQRSVSRPAACRGCRRCQGARAERRRPVPDHDRAGRGVRRRGRRGHGGQRRAARVTTCVAAAVDRRWRVGRHRDHGARLRGAAPRVDLEHHRCRAFESCT